MDYNYEDEDMEEVVRYFVYKDGEYYTQDEFDDINEAIEYAKENNCDDVEETVWNRRYAYNNYEQADRFKTVWKNN